MKKRPKLLCNNQNARVLIKLRKMISEKSLPFQLLGKFVLIETFLSKRGDFTFPAAVMTTTCPQSYGIFSTFVRITCDSQPSLIPSPIRKKYPVTQS